MQTEKHFLFFFSAFMIFNVAHQRPVMESLKTSPEDVVGVVKEEAPEAVGNLNGLCKTVGDGPHRPMKDEASRPILEKYEDSATSQQSEIHQMTQKSSEQPKSDNAEAPIQKRLEETSSPQLMTPTTKDAGESPSLLVVESKKPQIDYYAVLGTNKPEGITKKELMERIQSAFKEKALKTIPYYNLHDVNAEENFGRVEQTD
ncbi:hypothetical protein CROQUDRAFT_92923 [Cronartium quercuum f. sp. fusiforme G11]|uniref:Uncharacterized protein n=1 Tax=Cronartium quercuum f. sp. fusiforme G11 TaxID=708437 RepID=A0A9P6TBI4_9BASI|nr:hypothetical protein CROQUDRAFT_92923 [Cronartium quercuum f. sp. fusiforme G11]